MGLQSQLDDFSSDSIPLFLISFFANFLNHLRFFFLRLLHSLPLSAPFLRHHHDVAADGDTLFLAEQLHLNWVFSYRYGGGVDDSVGGGSDCIVCLCSLSDGDRVRRLSCRHVFHKDCFDGWLHHLNFNCPLCRSPLVSEERVPFTRRRVGENLIGWVYL